ncbi:hypothetical protein B0H11DRAFT_1921817 [Mycena galericulata]|nr:hypothetical protein B0H11DRAFT_1921817 [Mycena galericulata]
MWPGKKTSDTEMVSSYCEFGYGCAEDQVLSDSGVEIAATKASARCLAPASKAPSVETMMQGTTAESDTETYCGFRSTCAEKTKSQRGSEARHCDNQGIVADFCFGEYAVPTATTTQISDGKKTAHTEAERKAILENDIWTGLDSVLSWTEVEDESLETKYDSRMARASKSVVCTRRGRKSYSKARAPTTVVSSLKMCIRGLLPMMEPIWSFVVWRNTPIVSSGSSKIGGEISGQTALHPNHRVLAGREIRKNISSLTRTAPQYVFRFWHPLGALEAWNIRKYQEDSTDIRLGTYF